MPRSQSIWKRLLKRKGPSPSVPPSRQERKRAMSLEVMEERIVLSTMMGHGAGGSIQVGHHSNDGIGEHGGEGGLGQSSLLRQDAKLVKQAFQSFDASYLSAAAMLRLTATATSGPTALGLVAFDVSIATAVTTLQSTIAADLTNLTNTGAAITSTINGYITTLQTEIDSAATGLANSTNDSVRALNREARGYERVTVDASIKAIVTDAPLGSLTGSTLETAAKAARSAYQTFNLAVYNSAQASIKTGTALSSTDVTSAVSALQTSLNTAVTGLGTAFNSSNAGTTLATTISTNLASLSTDLAAIAAPTTGNKASARLFLKSVFSTVAKYESMITQAAISASQAFNISLL